MTVSIFLDSDCEESAGEVLYEGRKYFLLLPNIDKEIIAEEFRRASLTDFISWSRHNKVATIQVINRIGLIKLFGSVFDVRSEKFFEGESGTRQFELLLDDLVELSRQIIFDYSSPTSAYRTHRKDTGASILERFNYYRQRFYRNQRRDSIEQCVESVLLKPHSRLRKEGRDDFIWNVRQPTAKTMQSFVSHSKQLVDVTGDRGQGQHFPGWQAPGKARRFMPLRAITADNIVDNNTPENKFVKYVLTDVEQVCLSIMKEPLVPASVKTDCLDLLKATRRQLRHPFFRAIGTLDYFPSSSPTLVSQHGYRELYTMFLRSRNGAQHLFEDLAAESSLIDLKDVAQLYEYWVFYRIAVFLLGKVAVVQDENVTVKRGRLVNAIEISNHDIRIAFNKTYTRGVSASYSLTLRPDICVTVGSGQSQQLFVLDAKYKSIERSEAGDEDEPILSIRVVKAADLHKMHCYIDAIHGVQAAIAVYPGNKAVFYPRDRSMPILNKITPTSKINGIGAAPLSPGSDSSDFDSLMDAIKNCIHH